MFERIRNGLSIAGQCWEVLKHDKELVLFPLFSSLSLWAVTASFVLPLWDTDYVQMYVDCIHEDDAAAAQKYWNNTRDPLFYLILFRFYLSQYFVMTFFNVALVACALVRLNGGDPTVAVGLRFARSRLSVILAWSAFSAAIGVILRAIESRSNNSGRIAIAVLGVAWTIGSYLVVPVLVVERLGPIAAFKRSAEIISRTWGEALGANVGIGAISGLCCLVACIPAAVGYAMQSAFALGIGVGISVVLVVGIKLVASTLESVLLAALYIYADQGKVPRFFTKLSLSNAFVERS
ncbi:MAG: DUF6159 family protein [Pirellulaceae bacterium]